MINDGKDSVGNYNTVFVTEQFWIVFSYVCVTDLFSLFASDLGGYAAREEIEAVLDILDGETPASLQKCFIEVSQRTPSSECFLLCKEIFGYLSLQLMFSKPLFRAVMVYI